MKQSTNVVRLRQPDDVDDALPEVLRSLDALLPTLDLRGISDVLPSSMDNPRICRDIESEIHHKINDGA